MSLQRRLQLLAWAAANKAWIIEDDYDSEYRYSGPPLASLQGLDRADCTIYVGTLSKVLFPGLRLGYMVAPLALVDPLVRAKAVTDRHTAIVPQMTLADFIAGGHFARHIKRTREANAERRDALLRGLHGSLADHLVSRPSDTGLELCVHFRRKRSEAAVIEAGRANGIELRGLGHYVDAGAGSECAVKPGLLLGFASISPEEIQRGVSILTRILHGA
jgi:GntR family transcriptional regulator/MocR family aminotransferase